MALEGTQSIRFGVPDASHYGEGERTQGAFELGTLHLPAGSHPTLTFHVWMDVEEGKSWDVLSVKAKSEHGVTPLWTKDYDNVVHGEWNSVSVPLYAFTGRDVTLSFSFDTVDHTYNDTLGVFVDEVWVTTDCDTPLCSDASDCDDGLACTVASCLDGHCHFAATPDCCDSDVACDDTDNCTLDRCEQGQCIHTPVEDPLCCNTAADCDDGLPCTIDSCTSAGSFRCTHTLSADPGCCATASDCDDGDVCSIDRCRDNSCQHIEACCDDDADCDDGDDLCTLDSCLGGFCHFAANTPEGCCDDTPFLTSFEDPDHGWTFNGGDDGCLWQVSPYGHQSSGQGALYYGNLTQGNFDCGTTQGEPWSPDFTLPVDATYILTANLWLDTEGGGSSDTLELWLKQGNASWLLWQKTSATQIAQWETLSFDLSAFAGHDLRVGWRFDSKDNSGNDGEGVYIDDIKVASNCTPRSCSSPWDCDDSVAFTQESCVAQRCSWLATAQD